MAEVSWIKLKTTMFDDEKIRLIQSLPESDAIIVIWVRLLVLAGKTNDDGLIYIQRNMPYTDEMLASLFNKNVNVIRLGLQTLEKFGMIDLGDDGLIYIQNWDKHQNVEGMEKIRIQNAQRSKKYREKKKQAALEQKEPERHVTHNVTVTSRHATDTEEDTDKETDTEQNKSKTTEQEQLIANAIQNVSGMSVSSFSSIASQLIAEALSKYSMSDIEQMFSYKWHDWDGWHKREERFVVETLLSADNLDKYMSEMRQPKQRSSKREVHEKRPDFDKTEVPKVSAEDKVAAAATLEQLNGDQE